MEVLSVTTFMNWLQLHQEWLAVTIGLIAFFESLVIVGIALPGVVMLFTAATIAGSGGFDVWTMLFAGFVGAVLGDGISFLVGYIWHERVRTWWPFRQHPEWLDKGEQFFIKYGSASVVFGRFVGPVRPVIPVVSGIMNMSPHRFFFVNILSAVAWSPVYLMPGYLAGASMHWAHVFSIDLAYVLAGAVVLAFALSAVVMRFQPWFESKTIMLIALAALMLVALVMSLGASPLNLLNMHLHQWFMGLHTPLATEVISVYTNAGIKPFHLAGFALAAIWLWRDGNLMKGLGFLGLAFLLLFFVTVLKDVTEIARPATWLSTSFSFPSRHVAVSGFLLLWFGHYFSQGMLSRYRLWIWSTVVTLTFWMLVTRLYLGAHWLTDVCGGLLVCIIGFLVWLWVHKQTGELRINGTTYIYRVVQLIVLSTAATCLFVWRAVIF